MNPFEKRDKIPRTPPGQSFLDHWSLDKSGIDCSVYDESGVRRFSPEQNCKRYTLTFENNGVDLNTSIYRSHSVILNSSRISSLCTSSPVNNSRSDVSFSLSMVGTVVRNPVQRIVDKENMEPVESLPSGPEPITVKRVLGRKRPNNDRSMSADLSSSLVSDEISTVRQLRPRSNRNNNPIQPDSFSAPKTRKRKKPDRKKSTSVESSDQSSDASSTSWVCSPNSHVTTCTPPTIVPSKAGPVRSRRNTSTISKNGRQKRLSNTTIHPTPIVKARSNRLGRLTESDDLSRSNSRDDLSMIETPNNKSTTVGLQDEPIAARLRRMPSRISYMEPKLNRKII